MPVLYRIARPASLKKGDKVAILSFGAVVHRFTVLRKVKVTTTDPKKYNYCIFTKPKRGKVSDPVYFGPNDRVLVAHFAAEA